MGLESRVYFKTNYGGRIASVELSKMGSDGVAAEFYTLFDRPYTEGLYPDLAGLSGEGYAADMQVVSGKMEEIAPDKVMVDVPDVVVTKDYYDEQIKYTTLDRLWEWCHKAKSDTTDDMRQYRRFDLLYKLTKSFIENPAWNSDEIIVVLVNH